MRTQWPRLLIYLLFIYAAQWAAAAPPLVNYQGFLTDAGGQPLNDVMKLTFRIWSVQEGGTVAANLIWAETHSNVSVVDGRINVILGNDTATPVQADLEIAQNDVASFGDAFLGDNLFIGITMNDANESYDPGEEVSPRQQLLSVPYALNGGGSVISGFLVDPADEPLLLHHVVEVVPKTNQLQPATDLAATQWYTRGIYLGGGRIQVSGGAPSYLGHVEPGEPLYLSTTTPGQIVDAAAPDLEGRPFATLVGFGATSGTGIQLNFQYVQLTTDVLLAIHKRPLQTRNFDFTTNEFWSTFNPDNPNNPAPAQQFYNSGCRGGNGVLPYLVRIHQIVSLAASEWEYLHPLIDAGGLQVTYGCWAYGSVGTKGRIRLDFYDEPPSVNIPPGFDYDEFDFLVPSGACNQILNAAPTCVPPGTRFIGVSFWSPDNTSAQFDDMIFEFSTVTTPGAYP